MSYATAPDYLAVITQLPPGTFFHADNVSWEVYERLLADLSPSAGIHVFYDQGRMEAVSPTAARKKSVKVVFALVQVLREALDIDVESHSQTSIRSQKACKGAEPDDSFYVYRKKTIIGAVPDLLPNMVPDIVVQSEFDGLLLDRFAIYAALDVSEIWCVSDYNLKIWLLKNGAYVEAGKSEELPFLDQQILNEFLVKGLKDDDSNALSVFGDLIKSLQ